MAESGNTSDGTKGRSRTRRPQRRTQVQNDVLRQSMADAISGSFLNSGSDSTAALLANVSTDEEVAAPAESPQAPDEPHVPAARSDKEQPQPSAPQLARPEPGATASTLSVPAESAAEAPMPVPDPTPGPASPAQQATAARPKREAAQPTPPPPRSDAGGWAHAALQGSFLDNRINSQAWDTWGFRLVPDVKKRLEQRIADDKRSADNRRLAQGHYVNAAMLHVPAAVDEQLDMIKQFMLIRGGYTDPGRPSNYRVSQQVWEMARDLDMEITAAAKRGLVIFLFSAAVERLLDALDEEGPLQRPNVFRRVQ